MQLNLTKSEYNILKCMITPPTCNGSVKCPKDSRCSELWRKIIELNPDQEELAKTMSNALYTALMEDNSWLTKINGGTSEETLKLQEQTLNDPTWP